MLGLNCEHLQHTSTLGICVPMLSKGEVIGVIHTVFRDRLTNEQQQLIGMFDDTVALAITNLRLYEKLHFQSIHDGLTGLYNRRFLEESLDYELRRAARMNKPLCNEALDYANRLRQQVKQLNIIHKMIRHWGWSPSRLESRPSRPMGSSHRA
jgi:hypothetical protein